MRTLLRIVLFLQIVSVVVAFCLLMVAVTSKESVLLPLLLLFVSVLNIALVYVVLKNADEVDELKEDMAKLKRSTFAIFSQTPTLSENAPTEWECPKCGTENRKGTQKCCKCSTRYFSVDQ